MIRAGRVAFVQNSADLAAAMGLALGSFRNQKPFERDGFPDTVSPPEAKTKLWDAEQTAAYLAGHPVPPLPQTDHAEDLLERTEAAALLNVKPKSWDTYRKDPRIAPHLVKVRGVEHCPRHALWSLRESPPAVHRPKGSGDLVPRDELDARVGELLDADPAVTLAIVQDELGIAYSTAARVLPRLRGERIATLVADEPDLALDEAALRLGYPTAVHRAAVTAAEAALRRHRVQPYLQQVADTAVAQGWAQEQQVVVRQTGKGVLAAAVVLSAAAPVPALVWDERYGWRTAVSRRHPMGRDSGRPAQGEGIRYLSPHQQPTADEVFAALRDGSRGTRRPTVVHSPLA